MAAIVRPTITYARERGVRDGTSPREKFGPDMSGVTRKLFVPWSERYEAVKRFVGYSQIERNDEGEPRQLRRLTPLPYPPADFLYAVDVPNITHHKVLQGVLLSDGTTYPIYEQSELEIVYEHVPYDVLQDDEVVFEYERFTSISGIRPSADYLMLPGGTLQYIRNPLAPNPTAEPNARTIPFNIGRVLPTLELKVKWHMLPYDIFPLNGSSPWGRRVFGDPQGDPPTRPFLGTVNESELFGRPAGTVLFSAVDLQLRRFPGIDLAWDIEFTFGIDPNYWNFKYFYGTTTDTAPYTGFYFCGKGPTYYEPGIAPALPDDYSIYNQRDLRLLWSVS